MTNFSCFIVAFILLVSCSSKQDKKDLSPYEKMQAEAINFISQPSFSGDYIFYKVTAAKANLERYYVDTKQLYFTCNKQDYTDVNLNKFVMSKDSITLAKQENGTLVLGTLNYNDTSKVFFKMPLSNFRVDSTKVIETPYKENLTYKITLPQILNFTYLRSTLGGGAIAITEDQHHFMNHGSVVAKAGEPSLTDFVSQLTRRFKTTEEKTQALLDFVTNEIEYNQKEADNGYETIKRPNEVMFTKNSDCSGKAILYASLLQQVNAKWCLFYFKDHICVGVAGKYEQAKPHKFKLNGTEYYLAEITDPHAKIGKDSWNGEMNESNLEYYQVSDKGSDVFSYKTNKKLDFVTGKVKE